jgi:hypothetical protein
MNFQRGSEGCEANVLCFQVISRCSSNCCPVEGSCEHDNEPSSSMKLGNFLTSWATISFSGMTLRGYVASNEIRYDYYDDESGRMREKGTTPYFKVCLE